MRKFNLITVNKEILEDLYKDNALTFEGLSIEEESLNQLFDWLEENGVQMKTNDVYITPGGIMNEIYHLRGKNRYPVGLHIVSVKLADMVNMGKIITARFMVGGRWMNDVIDNNRRRN